MKSLNNADALMLPPHVVNYHLSSCGMWCLLVTLTYSHSGEFIGEMQLYSLEKQVGQMLSGRNGVFTQLLIEGRHKPVEVLCFEHKDEDGNCMIRIMEIGFDASISGGCSAFKTEPIPLDNIASDDFPVAMAVCPKFDVLYVFTSKGIVFLIAIESGVLLCRQHIEVGTIFASSPCSRGGVFYMTRNDTEISHIGIDFDEICLLLENSDKIDVIETLGRKKDNNPIEKSDSSNVLQGISTTTAAVQPPQKRSVMNTSMPSEKLNSGMSYGGFEGVDDVLWNSEDIAAIMFDDPYSTMHPPNHFSPPPPPQSIAPEEKSSQPPMIGANENVRILLILLL